jgi:hypothetical protein
VPVQTIEQEFLSYQTKQNYGIREDCDVYQFLSCLGHLKVSNGMVYPLQDKSPPYRPIVGSSVTANYTSNIHNSEIYRFIPAGQEGEIDVMYKQNGTVYVHNELNGQISSEDDADIAEAIYKLREVTVEDTKDPVEGVYRKN